MMAEPSEAAKVSGQNTHARRKRADLVQKNIPIGRLGKPSEIADVVYLLASNAYMTNKVRARVEL